MTVKIVKRGKHKIIESRRNAYSDFVVVQDIMKARHAFYYVLTLVFHRHGFLSF